MRVFLIHVNDGRSAATLPSDDLLSISITETRRPLLSSELDARLPKDLQRLNSRYWSIQQLLDTGMIIQAWTMLPSLVREAELSESECTLLPLRSPWLLTIF